jgi:hypothetical protein
MDERVPRALRLQSLDVARSGRHRAIGGPRIVCCICRGCLRRHRDMDGVLAVIGSRCLRMRVLISQGGLCIRQRRSRRRRSAVHLGGHVVAGLRLFLLFG